MVASQAAMEQSPEGIVMEMSADMEAHAAAGDWERVEDLAVRIRSAVMAVPESQRREALLAVRRSMEHVQTAAHDARSDVTEKLSAIRRGKDATRAYAGTD